MCSQVGSADYGTDSADELCESLLADSVVNKNFTCFVCSKQLFSEHTLRDHIRAKHLTVKSEQCRICGERFAWRKQLARHRKQVHGPSGS